MWACSAAGRPALLSSARSAAFLPARVQGHLPWKVKSSTACCQLDHAFGHCWGARFVTARCVSAQGLQTAARLSLEVQLPENSQAAVQLLGHC